MAPVPDPKADAYERSGNHYVHLVICGGTGFYSAVYAHATRKAAEESAAFLTREQDDDRRYYYVDSIQVRK